MQTITQTQVRDSAEDRRVADMRAFVASSEWKGGEIVPLRADASVRRFYRVVKNGRTAVLMEARPPLEDTEVFEIMQGKLRRIGLTVPDIYACDHAHGLVLMEDFGDERYFELITSGKGDIKKLYELAVDVLVHKRAADPAIALAESVAYSDQYWLFRVEQFLLHYMPHVMHRTVGDTAREDFLGLFHDAISAAHEFDPVLLHGDYGAQNLYYFPDRPGVKALGLIDFQDMTDARGNMMGSPAFDLVFLLQDVRTELPAGMETAMLERFLDGAGIKNRHGFAGEYAILGTAQAVKCLGLFARLGHGEGRSEYLRFIPYCWRNIARNLSHPALKDIRAWFEKNNIDPHALERTV